MDSTAALLGRLEQALRELPTLSAEQQLTARAALCRELESSLRERDAQLRLSLRASGLGLWAWDFRADNAVWTPEVYAIVGLAPGDFSGASSDFFKLVHHEDRQHLEATIRAAATNRATFDCVFRLIRPDGELRWIQNRGQAYYGPDGEAQSVHGTIGDVTERVRADAALRESESFYRQTLETIPGIAFTNTPDGACDFLSEQWMTFTGRSIAEHLGTGWLDAVHPEDRARVHQGWDEAIARRADYHLEFRLRRHDGQHEWFTVRARPIQDAEGKIVRWVGALVNVEELKQAHAALFKRKREFRALADNSPDIIARFDRQLRHVFVNARIGVLVGRPAADFLGKTNAELGMPATLCAQWDAGIRKVFAEAQPVSCEFSIDSQLGTRDLVSRLVPELGPEGRVETVLCVTRDVTEALAAEAARRESEALFLRARRAARVGIWDLDLAAGDGTWSTEAFELFDREPVARVTPAFWLACVHPDDVERSKREVDEALAGGPYRAEYRVLHRDGTVHWISSEGDVVRDEQGKPVRLVGTVRSIDVQKNAEHELRESARHKDEFLAILAHELRNPLAPLRNGLELLRHDPLGEQAGRTREMMKRQLDHLVRLVDDLLDVSRISTGKVELRRERLSIDAVIEHALETARPLIDGSGRALIVQSSDRPLHVQGDLTRLSQVLGNLLNNAAKYTAKGGRIELRAEERGAEVVLSVFDDGLGFEAEMLPRVFNLFSQSKRARDSAQGGLGIGLALVRQLTLLHGGRVEAHSEGLGRGSRFSVWLPLVEAPAVSTSSQTLTQPSAPAARRVLIVDDNVDAAETLSMMLTIFGHQTRIVHDGPQALVAAREERPDLVFLDIGLPGMDGYQVARQLRVDPCVRGAMLVALTGWGTAEDRRLAAEAGFDVHLTKPIEVSSVEKILARPVPLSAG